MALGCGARVQSRSSTYLRGWKWAGMGRNTVPEVKPPTPSHGAGDVPEGNHSALHRPPSPTPRAFLASRPLPSLLFLLSREEDGSTASRGRSCLRPKWRGRAGKRGGLRGRGRRWGWRRERLRGVGGRSRSGHRRERAS